MNTIKLSEVELPCEARINHHIAVNFPYETILLDSGGTAAENERRRLSQSAIKEKVRKVVTWDIVGKGLMKLGGVAVTRGILEVMQTNSVVYAVRAVGLTEYIRLQCSQSLSDTPVSLVEALYGGERVKPFEEFKAQFEGVKCVPVSHTALNGLPMTLQGCLLEVGDDTEFYSAYEILSQRALEVLKNAKRRYHLIGIDRDMFYIHTEGKSTAGFAALQRLCQGFDLRTKYAVSVRMSEEVGVIKFNGG